MRAELCVGISMRFPLSVARYQTWAIYSVDQRVPVYALAEIPLFMRRLTCR